MPEFDQISCNNGKSLEIDFENFVILDDFNALNAGGA